MADPRLRQIHIQTGVVRRLAREEAWYRAEAEQQEEEVERLKAEREVDALAVRKQTELLDESRMMIPDCRRRLVRARAALVHILDTHGDLAESDEYKEARTVLDSVTL